MLAFVVWRGVPRDGSGRYCQANAEGAVSWGDIELGRSEVVPFSEVHHNTSKRSFLLQLGKPLQGGVMHQGEGDAISEVDAISRANVNCCSMGLD